MPNFPSIYLELQEIWKRLNNYALDNNDIKNSISILPAPNEWGAPVTYTIDNDWDNDTIIPVTSAFLIINYQRTDDIQIKYLQTEGISNGTRLVIMSSPDSNDYFEIRRAYSDTTINGNIITAYAPTDFSSTTLKFYKHTISELLYYNNYWRLLTYQQLVFAPSPS